VIAGTGTVAVGRDPVGNEFRTIGEGRTFGDFGDEFDVSELAVAAVADQYTGRGPATMLTDMLCERLGESSVEAMLERLARFDPRFRAPELQNLTPMVLAATEAGDLVARTVLERIGEALGEAAGVVARRLNLSNLPVDAQQKAAQQPAAAPPPPPTAPADPTKAPGAPTTAVGERSPFVHPQRAPVGEITGTSFTPHQDLEGTITPNDFGGAGVAWFGTVPRGNSNVYSRFRITYAQ